VPAFCPAPERHEDGVIHGPKGPLADHVPVIVGPSPYEGVEPQYQLPGRGLPVGLDYLPDFGEERLDVLPGRFNEQLVPVLAYVEAQEVEAVFDMRDDCLLG